MYPLIREFIGYVPINTCVHTVCTHYYVCSIRYVPVNMCIRTVYTHYFIRNVTKVIDGEVPTFTEKSTNLGLFVKL